MGGGRWESGRIIQLFYEPGEEDEGPFAAAGLQLTFPYQARLDRGSFHDQPRNIFATADADHCVRLPDGIVDDGNAGYDAFEEESLDLLSRLNSPPSRTVPSAPFRCPSTDMAKPTASSCGAAASRSATGAIWNAPWQRGSGRACRALELMHRAASLGDATSAMNLAHKYKKGEDVKRNREKAKRLFMMGARLGGRTDAFNFIASMKLRMGGRERRNSLLCQGGQARGRNLPEERPPGRPPGSCHAGPIPQGGAKVANSSARLRPSCRCPCRDVLPPREFEDALKARSQGI